MEANEYASFYCCVLALSTIEYSHRNETTTLRSMLCPWHQVPNFSWIISRDQLGRTLAGETKGSYLVLFAYLWF